jgi:hypothetical protein
MKNRFLPLLSLFTICALTTLPAFAEGRIVNLALGSSVPASDADNDIETTSAVPGGAISRRFGGEVVGLVFADPETNKEIKAEVLAVRLIGYSASGKGKVLIRRAESRPQISDDDFLPLSRYSKMQAGSHAQSQNGFVMLGQGDIVTFTPKNPVSASRLILILEAFGDQDASVDIQLVITRDSRPLGIGFKRLLVADFEEQSRNSGSGRDDNRANQGSGISNNNSNNNSHDSNPPTGHIHSGSCISHGPNGQCEMWSK